MRSNHPLFKFSNMKPSARLLHTCLLSGALALSVGPNLVTAQVVAETTESVTDILPSAAYESVIKINNSSQVADYRTPWNPGNFSGGSGTGFLVGENRFLTNAHVVSNSRRLLVTKHGSPREIEARIVAVAHDCDLALLEIVDKEDYKSFFGNVSKLAIGTVPKLESEVRVIGYPVGGERISVTRGVVSRIDFSTYSHSQTDQHLVVQIDAAINPGNSGGPVLQKDKVVGVAFQGLTSADNTGYIIPTPVIKRFLKDVEDGSYDHYVDLAIDEFPLMNPAQRKALGLPNDDRGMLVVSVMKNGSCDGVLEDGDVLMSIDGFPVFSNGKVKIDGESVNMHEVVERKFAGDKVKMEFLRNGEKQSATATLKQFLPADMYRVVYGVRPRFVTVAGLVFQPLDRNVMASHSLSDMDARNIIADYVSEELYTEWPEIVVLTEILPDAINTDVTGLEDLIVDEVNGTKIRSLQQLYDALYKPMSTGKLPEFTVIKCIGAPRPIVFESDRILAAHQRIRQQYGVSNDYFLDYENYEVPVAKPTEESSDDTVILPDEPELLEVGE